MRPQVVLLPDPSTEHGFRPEAEDTEDKESFVTALVALAAQQQEQTAILP